MVENKEILFRVDAGGKVGLGHFYRSVSLSKELSNHGWNVVFCHKYSEFWDDQLLVTNHFVLEENEEAHQLKYLKDHNIPIYYLDGLIEVSDEFYQEASKNSRVVFHQNNTDSRARCDIFIMPAIHYDPAFFDGFRSTSELYKGLDYVILNEKVLEQQTSCNNSEDLVLSVITGGSDPKGVALTLYNMLDFKKVKNLQIVFLLGEDFMHRDKIPVKVPSNIIFENFDWEVIAKSDLLLSTFGVTTYELMYLSKPIISIGHAKANAHASRVVMNKTNSVVDLGLIDDLHSDILNSTINDLALDKGRRFELSMKGKNVIDGKGCERVSKILRSIS